MGLQFSGVKPEPPRQVPLRTPNQTIVNFNNYYEMIETPNSIGTLDKEPKTGRNITIKDITRPFEPKKQQDSKQTSFVMPRFKKAQSRTATLLPQRLRVRAGDLQGWTNLPRPNNRRVIR